MKNNIYTSLIIILLLVITGCSPKYEIKKKYDSSNLNLGCANKCEIKEQNCLNNCENKHNVCLFEAKNKAIDIFPSYEYEYKNKLLKYKILIFNYNKKYRIWLRENKNLKYDYNYYNKKYYEKNKNSYECKKKEYFKSRLDNEENIKPIPPKELYRVTLNQLINNEQNKCSFNCDCKDRYDRCFSKCGGKIIYQKFCIANCEN